MDEGCAVDLQMKGMQTPNASSSIPISGNIALSNNNVNTIYNFDSNFNSVVPRISPLQLAVYAGNVELVNALASKVDLNYQDQVLQQTE